MLWVRFSGGDSGKTEFNFSELLGNSTAVAISNAYYADRRTASNGISQLAINFSADLGGNVLKEFWPDFERNSAENTTRRMAVCSNEINLTAGRSECA
jgi:hypothetical protein